MLARDIVAIVELVFYVPTAILALLSTWRHGFKRSSGWIYTVLLCIIRIVGAICQLLLNKNHSTGLITTTIILSSVGLSPLLLATLGILNRCVDFINSKSTPTFTMKHFRIVQLLIVVGLILAIAGGTSNTSSYTEHSNGTVQVATTSKVAIILYIVAYIAIVLIYAASVGKTSLLPGKERRVPLAIVVALPFILVRLVYSACSVFIHNHLFNSVTGNVAVFVAMALIEEFVVILIYIVLGFSVDKLDESRLAPMSEPLKNTGRGGTTSYQNYTPVEGQGHNADGSQMPMLPYSGQNEGVAR